jgi:hypothetical protein
MTIFSYYNEPLDEIAGRSSLFDWTGQENPSSAMMETLGIHEIAIPDEKAGMPFTLTKEGNGYIAVFPEPTTVARFGCLSSSDRGNAILLTQTNAPGQPIHKAKTSEKVLISAVNELPTDVLLFLKWGDTQSSYRLRAFSGMTALPALYIGEDIEISGWADTQGVSVLGGWEG